MQPSNVTVLTALILIQIMGAILTFEQRCLSVNRDPIHFSGVFLYGTSCIGLLSRTVILSQILQRD